MVREIIDERKAFNQYQAYLAGRIEDPNGSIGHNIASRVEKLSSMLGFSNASDWLESFKESNSFSISDYISQLSHADIKFLYLSLSNLGKDRRGTNEAVSLIGTYLDELYGNGRLFLRAYSTQRKVISQVKKECKKRIPK